MNTNISPFKKDAQYQLELIQVVLNKQKITFSKREASKLVGGESRLEKLIINGDIRMEKPTAKQNGKWFCNASDVIKFVRL